MCGITGWINLTKNLEQYKQDLINMTDTLANRGPDAQGFYIHENLLLGHRRLVVVDPENGKQPMIKTIGDRKYVIVYNGELYNTEDIKSVLKLKGYTFQGHSDTEVLLTSYIEWGPECVNYLNGIFAFGLWDEYNKIFFIARDRMGVKPLFYSYFDNNLIFGSELKAILKHPFIKAEIDEQGICEIFGLGPARTPGCGVFKGISELRPAHTLIIDQNGLKVKRYWQLQSHEHPDDLDTTTEKVYELLTDSIKRQLVSDVPVCAFLSGGLDSSTLSHFAAKTFRAEGKDTLNTFSIDYTDNSKYFKSSDFTPNFDTPYINLMSKEIGSIHHNFVINIPELVESLKEAMIARDLPGMADVDSSLYLFCKEIKRHATVGLSGECADEIFGGYPWFFREDSLTSNTFPWSLALNERDNILSKGLREKLHLKDYINERYYNTLSEVPVLSSDTPQDARIREIFYLNLTWFMTTLLDRKDRMSMANGLEVRVPFCDHRIVEYVWNIPWSIKTVNGMEKGILRRALEKDLPNQILTRKKSPYPKTHNPLYTSMVSKIFEEILDDKNSPILQLVDFEVVSQIAKSGGTSFGRPWFGQLMTGPQLIAYLIQINMWLKEYKIEIK